MGLRLLAVCNQECSTCILYPTTSHRFLHDTPSLSRQIEGAQNRLQFQHGFKHKHVGAYKLQITGGKTPKYSLCRNLTAPHNLAIIDGEVRKDAQALKVMFDFLQSHA